MSNPSVFELAKTEIDGSTLCIEDNIGEAIHMHLGPLRIDLTIREFLLVTEKLELVLEFLLKEKGIVLKDYDPYFLLNFSENFLDILYVEERETGIGDLKIKYINKEGNFEIKKITESPFYKYYKNEEIDLEIYENMSNILQSNRERADEIYKIISKGIYEEMKLIVIDKEGYILDGEEKASAMLALYGRDYFCKVKIFMLNEEKKLGRRLKEKKW
ncbi:MAG: hypothetical protein ACRC1R_08035 [Cetobacterium sp.]|uniref:hypothetical protein n=1 Tax=Cetobacterium sp. TaxID=2071632 RepID=UPI003F384929